MRVCGHFPHNKGREKYDTEIGAGIWVGGCAERKEKNGRNSFTSPNSEGKAHLNSVQHFLSVRDELRRAE